MRLSSTLAILLASTTTLAFAQSIQAIRGTVTDSMCGAHHMMKNLSAAQCMRECVKSGSDVALLSEGKLYTLKGDTSSINKWAGQNVTVHGKISGSTISVVTITAR